MSDFARGLVAVFAYSVAAVVLFSVVISAVIKAIKKGAKERRQEEAQNDAWANPRLEEPPAAPTRRIQKPVDPNDIQISGAIPIIGEEEDISKSKTQPIPVVKGETPETKILQVQDHILESFYRKISDPKSYDWDFLPEDFRMHFGADAMPMFEAYVVYDTGRIAPGLVEMMYFTEPVGRAGKTYLETNLQVGGVLFASAPGGFVSKTTILRFIGNAGKDDVKQVLEGGVYEFIDSMTHTQAILSPLSSFSPLNPFDPDPKVFFLVHKDILIREYGGAYVTVRFPRQLGQVGSFELKIELPGIKIRPNYKRVQYR